MSKDRRTGWAAALRAHDKVVVTLTPRHITSAPARWCSAYVRHISPTGYMSVKPHYQPAAVSIHPTKLNNGREATLRESTPENLDKVAESEEYWSLVGTLQRLNHMNTSLYLRSVDHLRLRDLSRQRRSDLNAKALEMLELFK